MISEGEGRHEVEAARNRLVAAKALAASASKNMETAEKMMNDATATLESAKKGVATAKENKAAARSQLDSTQKAIEDAEKMLKDAERRWDAIDTLVDISNETEEPSRKKRKNIVSLNHTDPQGASNNNDGSATQLAEVSSGAASSANTNTTAASAAQSASSCRRSSDTKTKSESNSDDANNNDNAAGATTDVYVQQIEVYGCGIPEVNGTYILQRDKKKLGQPTYAKAGTWNSAPMKFEIFVGGVGTKTCCWYISAPGISAPNNTFYWTKREKRDAMSSSALPPESASQWKTHIAGKLPVPKLKRGIYRYR